MSEAYGNNDDNFDEDSLQTLKREVFNVGLKVKYTILLIPGDREQSIAKLKNWDLWGPLLICFLFTTAIGIEANAEYVYDSFANVFLIFWIGSFLASVNSRLMGNKGSIFQSISIIGYCMIPLAIFGFIVALLPQSTPSFVNLLLILFGLLWSVVSCTLVLRDLVAQTRRYLCAYPILLFYIFLAWYAVVA